MQFCLPHKATALAAHKLRWQDCSACPLSSSRRQVVLWRGYIPCDVLFLGEAPGLNEDREGYPFVGESGNLLEDLINYTVSSLNIGEIRQVELPTICITNVVACMPIMKNKNAIREPEKDEIKECSPRLQELIQIAEPKVIIGVGDIAAHSLKMKYEIIHPAAMLRMEKAQFAAAYLNAVTTLMEAFADASNT